MYYLEWHIEEYCYVWRHLTVISVGIAFILEAHLCKTLILRNGDLFSPMLLAIFIEFLEFFFVGILFILLI